MTTKVERGRADRVEQAAREADRMEFGRGRPVKVGVDGGEPMSSLAVRLSGEDIERLRVRAQVEGVGVTQMVRAWILARLDGDEPVSAEADQALTTLRRLLAHR